MSGSSRKLRAAVEERRHESGFCGRSISFADALAMLRARRGGSGPVTDAERAELATTMHALGYAPHFEGAPVDYEGGAKRLGMSADELRELLKR